MWTRNSRLIGATNANSVRELQLKSKSERLYAETTVRLSNPPGRLSLIHLLHAQDLVVLTDVKPKQSHLETDRL